MELKKGILGGAIAGIVAGIVDNVVSYPLVLAGLMGITEPFTMEEFPLPASIVIIGILVEGVISGVIYGAIYSKLYRSIPGEGLTKGVYYGLLIWIIKDIVAAMYMMFPFQAYYMALAFIVALPMWLIYGAVLEAICERIE